jgi:hypothetical protein
MLSARRVDRSDSSLVVEFNFDFYLITIKYNRVT